MFGVYELERIFHLFLVAVRRGVVGGSEERGWVTSMQFVCLKMLSLGELGKKMCLVRSVG